MKNGIKRPRFRLFALLFLLALTNLGNQGGFEVEEAVSCEDCEVEPEIRLSRYTILIGPDEVETIRAFTADRSFADWELIDDPLSRLVRKGLSAELLSPTRQTDFVDIRITLSEDTPEQPIHFRVGADLEDVGQAETSFTVKIVQPRIVVENPGPVVLTDAFELFAPEVTARVNVLVDSGGPCSDWAVSVVELFGGADPFGLTFAQTLSLGLGIVSAAALVRGSRQFRSSDAD